MNLFDLFVRREAGWGVGGPSCSIEPPRSVAVSEPPHLKDLMSDTSRLASIDLSDTRGGCQTHLQSDTHTHTNESAGTKADQSPAFPAAGPDSLSKSRYCLVSRPPGRMFAGVLPSGESGQMSGAAAGRFHLGTFLRSSYRGGRRQLGEVTVRVRLYSPPNKSLIRIV